MAPRSLSMPQTWISLALLLALAWTEPGACWSGGGGLLLLPQRPAAAQRMPFRRVPRAGHVLGPRCQVGKLYEEQEKLIVERGVLEGELMAGTWSPLAANVPKIKGVGAGGGFGGKGKKSKKAIADELKAEGKSHAAVLRRDGVVRIDKVLSHGVADALRAWAFDHRVEARAEVDEGRIGQLYRFADVLLKHNRCDLTMPLGQPVVMSALTEAIIDSSVGATIQSLLGDAAPLYELSCLISDPGSQRQVVHPDTPYGARSGIAEDEPVLYTCFIALQDVTEDMGPTTWIPGTHTKKAHAQFGRSGTHGDDKDSLLSSTPSVLGLLPKGCCAIFDSRCLHNGGANVSAEGRSRALFYFTFKNPKVGNAGNPGSIRPELIGKTTLKELRTELGVLRDKGVSERLDELAATLH